jgi:hypothetical protein
MKITGKAIVLLILILVVIPVFTANWAEGLMQNKFGYGKFSMPRYLLVSYAIWLPVYLIYVAIALWIMHLLRKHRY